MEESAVHRDKHGQTYNLSSPSKNGWLEKRSNFRGEWRRRYFVLKDINLYWLESDEGPILGTASMTRSTVSSVPDKKHAFRFHITLQQEGSKPDLVLAAGTEREQRRWMDAIQSASTIESSILVSRSATEDAEDSTDFTAPLNFSPERTSPRVRGGSSPPTNRPVSARMRTASHRQGEDEDADDPESKRPRAAKKNLTEMLGVENTAEEKSLQQELSLRLRKKGFLKKRNISSHASRSQTTFKMRFFKLFDDRLHYFVHDTDEVPKGIFILATDMSVNDSPGIANCTFVVGNSKTGLYLQAITPQEKADWSDAIREAIAGLKAAVAAKVAGGLRGLGITTQSSFFARNGIVVDGLRPNTEDSTGRRSMMERFRSASTMLFDQSAQSTTEKATYKGDRATEAGTLYEDSNADDDEDDDDKEEKIFSAFHFFTCGVFSDCGKA